MTPSAGPTDCVHCGLCLESCPTYLELATEADSPRGRIVIMRGIQSGRINAEPAALRHLDLCLDCRACETACPSGVRYSHMIEAAREAVAGLARPTTVTRRWAARLSRWVSLQVLPYPRRLRRLTWLLRMAQAIGLPQWLRESGLAAACGLPPLPVIDDDAVACAFDAPTSASSNGHAGPIAMFAGCASDVFAPAINRAATVALAQCGFDVSMPPMDDDNAACCGAIHHHAGEPEQALALARRHIDAFESTAGVIVATAAGCGAMLKEYGRLLGHDAAYAQRAARFSARVRDVTEVLADSLKRAAHPQAAGSQGPGRRVCYHDPCHLCHAQGVRAAPRAVLQSMGAATVVPLAESEVCCGAAGAYMLTEPEMSGRLAQRKWRHIRDTGADVVATANIGCIIQLRQHQPPDLSHVRVCHVVELLRD